MTKSDKPINLNDDRLTAFTLFVNAKKIILRHCNISTVGFFFRKIRNFAKTPKICDNIRYYISFKFYHKCTDVSRCSLL